MQRICSLLLAVALPVICACSRTSQAATPQQQTSTSAVAQAPSPAEQVSYTAKSAEPLNAIARKHLARTKYMTVAELESALRQENSLPAKVLYVKAGTTLRIPGIEPQPIVEHPRNDPKDMEVRAIYLTGATAGSGLGLKMVEHWREVGGNAVVFDIKDSDGTTSIPFEHPLAPHNHHPIENLPKYVRWLHQHDMHAIARVALFRDEHIARDFPKLAVQSRSTGTAWKENGKQVWTDTSNPEVQAYDIALAKHVAESGVDEVQFDYVRFPAEGNQKDAKFTFETAHPGWKRADVIADFLERAHNELRPMGVTLSLDVFGVMAWQREVDLAHTGQDIVRMAHHADVISPMIYPSHFFGMDGYKLPGDVPEHFISTSMARFMKITGGSGVVIRPWLQAFAWKTKTYSPQYVMTQIKTSKAEGGIGFLLWNARNDYAKPYVAMTAMAASPADYFETQATLAAKRKSREEQVIAAANAPAQPVESAAAKPKPTKARKPSLKKALSSSTVSVP